MWPDAVGQSQCWPGGEGIATSTTSPASASGVEESSTTTSSRSSSSGAVVDLQIADLTGRLRWVTMPIDASVRDLRAALGEHRPGSLTICYEGEILPSGPDGTEVLLCGPESPIGLESGALLHAFETAEDRPAPDPATLVRRVQTLEHRLGAAVSQISILQEELSWHRQWSKSSCLSAPRAVCQERYGLEKKHDDGEFASAMAWSSFLPRSVNPCDDCCSGEG